MDDLKLNVTRCRQNLGVKMTKNTTNKTFNWENYTQGREEYQFEDLTEKE